jgi:hypothetical protein
MRAKGLALSGILVSAVGFINQFCGPIALKNIEHNYIFMYVSPPHSFHKARNFLVANSFSAASSAGISSRRFSGTCLGKHHKLRSLPLGYQILSHSLT